MISALQRLVKHEAFGGILLMLAAVAAMIVANSDFRGIYEGVLGSYLAVTFDGTGITKPLILWINDGLMAIFFFLIGLELKRELLDGKLKNPRDIVLPGVAAIGGMVFPAMIFAALNWGNPATIGGWAIPAATDIAFALGVLALLGDRVPASLKVFLLTLAILDDLGAILIIALFYTANLQAEYLLYALIPLAAMVVLNLKGAHRHLPFIFFGIILWFLVLRSGVHATLAGVVTAFLIPYVDKWGKSPARSMEHSLHDYVLYGIVPIFAFANAGVVLEGITWATLTDPLTLGIAGGLVIGKQVGVLGLSYLVVALGGARLPYGANWLHIYGISCLAGIGFTMSLFIGSLSFADPALINQVRLGVLSGSLVSGVLGFTALWLASGNTKAVNPIPEDQPLMTADPDMTKA